MMAEQADNPLGPRMFQRHRAGFTTQRLDLILQRRRQQTDSGSPVDDLTTINESAPSPQEEPASPRFFRSRDYRSFRERRVRDVPKPETPKETYTCKFEPPEPVLEDPYVVPTSRSMELRRSSVPKIIEEIRPAEFTFPRRLSVGQGISDEIRASVVAQLESSKSSLSLSGLQSIKNRHAMVSEKFRKLLNAEVEDPQQPDDATDDIHASDFLQKMSENPRLSSLYQRLSSLGYAPFKNDKPAMDHIDSLECDRKRPSRLMSQDSAFQHIEELQCEKKPTKILRDNSAVSISSEHQVNSGGYVKDSSGKWSRPSVNHVPEVINQTHEEQNDQSDNRYTFRRSYLNRKASFDSSNDTSEGTGYTTSSLRRHSVNTVDKGSILDEDRDIISPDVDRSYNDVESNLESMQEHGSSYHSMNEMLDAHSLTRRRSDAHRYGVMRGRRSPWRNSNSSLSSTDKTLSQNDLAPADDHDSSFSDANNKSGHASPERRVDGAEICDKQTVSNLQAEQLSTDTQSAIRRRSYVIANEATETSSINATDTSDIGTSCAQETVVQEASTAAKSAKIKKGTNTNIKETSRKSKHVSSGRSQSLQVHSSAVETSSIARPSRSPRDSKKKFNDNLAHGGSGVLDVRVTSTDTISDRNSQDSNPQPDVQDEVFIDDSPKSEPMMMMTNLDREASLSVDSLEGAQLTVELSDIHRLQATSSDYGTPISSSTKKQSKLRQQVKQVTSKVEKFVKKQQKGSHREDPEGEEVQNGVFSDEEVKRRSTSDLSVSSSTRTGMSRQSSRWSEARPISTTSLRNKLQTAANTRVSAKDQRILELMIKKREEDQRQKQLRETAQLAWEAEKAKASKARTEATRRQTLSEPRSKSQPRVKTTTKVRSGSVDTSRTNLNHYDNHVHRDDEKSCDKQPHTPQTLRVLQEREKKLLEKKRANLERKKSQELRLAEQEREKKEFQNQVKAKMQQDLRRAQQLRESKEKEEAKQRKLKTYYFKKKQEEKLQQIKKQSEEEQEHLAAVLDHKLAQAETNVQTRYERRLADTKQTVSDHEQRLEQSRHNQKRMQEEMDAWHAELQNYRKLLEVSLLRDKDVMLQMDEKAKEQACRQLEEKRMKTAEDLKHKQLLQKENMRRLLEQENEWKNDVEASIALKDNRSRMIQMEKDELLRESRSLAQASQMLREELRTSYGVDHIDKMSKRAELEARIQRPMDVTMSLSTLTLN